MSFLQEKLGWEPELNQGLIASVVFHIGILMLVYFGVPVLFQDDVIIEPLGIKAALVSDITAAPKVDKAGKPTDKPKKQQAEQPKKKKEPAPAPEKPKQTAAATPPPPVEEKLVALPEKEPEKKEPEKKEPEKKEPEKKAEKKPEKKPEKKKEEPDELANLLNDVLNQPQAEPPPEEPIKKATPEPAEPTEGPQTPEVSAIPMTASDQEGIKQQLIPCWNFDPGTPNPEQYVVTVRISLNKSTGQVLGTRIMDQGRMGDPRFAAIANSAARSVRNPACSPIRFPDGKGWDEIDVVFDLGKAINGGF